MNDLSTTYLGLKLKNPVIAGASGLTSDLKMIKQLEKAGAAAIVCKSLFEEEVQLDSLKFQKDIHLYDDIHPEMLTVFPDLEHGGPKSHLHWLKKVKQETSIPVIGSLNAVHDDVWLDYAAKIEETGVDAIELNMYRLPGFDDSKTDDVEKTQLNLLKKIKKILSIPVSVKISPYYTDILGFIRKLEDAGVDGVVVFNRIFIPNIDINKEEHVFPMTFSSKEDNRLTQKVTGLLFGMDTDICASMGIMDGGDLIRMLLAGADAIQVVSTLYRNSPAVISEMTETLQNWMEDKGYSGLMDFQGKLSRENQKQKKHWLYKRSQYIRMLMQSSESLAEQIL